MKTFSYHKECRVCNQVYYKKMIDEEQFTNLQNNQNVALDYKVEGRVIHGIATIKSLCTECGSVVNSKLS
jgi:hypothetical protein